MPVIKQKRVVHAFGIHKRYYHALQIQLGVDRVYEFFGDKELRKSASETLEKYSLTPPEEATAISNLVAKLLDTQKTPAEKALVVDATASIGGNYLDFFDRFPHTVGVELNRSRYSKLRDSVLVRAGADGAETECIRRTYTGFPKIEGEYCGAVAGQHRGLLFQSSFLDILPILPRLVRRHGHRHLVVFFDPPWGGRDYKKFSNLLLGLGGVPLHAIVARLKTDFTGTAQVSCILKLPLNYYLPSLPPTAQVIKMQKFQIVVV